MDLNELLIEYVNEDDKKPTIDLPDPALLQFYQNLKNRIYWIQGDIDEYTLDVVEKILYWNRQDKGKPINERTPIILYIKSGGGVLDIEETIVSIIKLSKTPVYAVAMGVVASAASLIYLSCHKRYALPHASFIFHQGSCSGMSGNYDEIQAAMDDYKRQVEKMTKFYIENTEFTEQEIREKIQHDWYIYTEEAIEKNIVNEIVTNIDDIL